jgi:hypothetical protein|tara:strand:+ start:7799 stop:8038 length:240 start_codon:yes stop_codon:yes gene_type:complete
MNIEYFLLKPERTDEYLTIGHDNGFGVFWGDQGLTALMRIVDREPDKLPEIQIRTDKNEIISISEFLDRIKNLKVRSNG